MEWARLHNPDVYGGYEGSIQSRATDLLREAKARQLNGDHVLVALKQAIRRTMIGGMESPDPSSNIDEGPLLLDEPPALPEQGGSHEASLVQANNAIAAGVFLETADRYPRPEAAIRRLAAAVRWGLLQLTRKQFAAGGSSRGESHGPPRVARCCRSERSKSR